ncbi:MAG TPA: MFS transporter [Streptosporangiaceae bacterium]|nr:MFS transporter [Streptosporangiaceae bacterium]
MPRHAATPVLLAYVAFALIGVGAGVNGVILVAQIDDYAVDKATIGITFFTASAGFVVAGITAGALINRFGFRIALAVGGGGLVLAGVYTATHPPFVAFVCLQVLFGYATGVLESVLNAYLAALPNATTLLNRLHAFFGVGALLGPPLATWIVDRTSWTVVLLVVGLAYVPVVIGFLVAYPRQRRWRPEGADGTTESAPAADAPGGGLLRTAVRQRGVLLGAALLAVYVGLELGVGNWGFSYLVQASDQSEALAGYSVSGYWLGLTLGRFLISPIAAKMGATAAGLMFACLAGVMAAAALGWLVPGAAVAGAAFVLLGFFLGPIFPTTMAVAPRLTSARLVPTAIGVMNAGSVVGGSALPWLAGAIAQGAGAWTLLPFAITLTLIQLAIWRPIAHRVRTGQGQGRGQGRDDNPSVAGQAG